MSYTSLKINITETLIGTKKFQKQIFLNFNACKPSSSKKNPKPVVLGNFMLYMHCHFSN